MSKSIAAWIEPHEEAPKPSELDAWLSEWGFDVTKPIQCKVDPEGWTWWTQEVEETAREKDANKF